MLGCPQTHVRSTVGKPLCWPRSSRCSSPDRSCQKTPAAKTATAHRSTCSGSCWRARGFWVSCDSGFVRPRFGLADALMLALVAWHTVSALAAFYVGSPRPAINALWDWVAIGATLILARQIIQTARDARAVIVVMLGLACGLSATAVHQYFVTIPADVRSYEAAKDSTESLYEQTGQWMPPDSTVRQQFENRLNSRLPAATFALSNSLAGFIVPWFVILFAITVAARRAGLLTAGAVGLTLMSVCLFLTGSRSGGLAVLVGSLLVVAISAWTSRLPRSILRTAAVAIIVAVIAALAIGFGTSGGACGALRSRTLARVSLRVLASDVGDDSRLSVARLRTGPISGLLRHLQIARGLGGRPGRTQLASRSLGDGGDTSRGFLSRSVHSHHRANLACSARSGPRNRRFAIVA